MDFSRYPGLLEGVVDQLIDEEVLGVSLEMHRAIKLGYYELLYPDESMYEKHEIVDVKGLDIFGNAPQATKKAVDCLCPECNRTLGAQKFAPHLEKCMGMGRNSSRLRKHKTQLDSDQDISDDNEDEWTYPEKKGNKRLKREKEKVVPSPQRRGSRPGRPSKNPEESFHNLKPSQQQHNVATFGTLPTEYKSTLLQQICGVVSERTGRLCTRSVNCPQHTLEQRQDVRKRLLRDSMVSPMKRTRESSFHKTTEVNSDEDSIHTPPLITAAARKKLKKHRRTKGGSHGTVTTTTVLHSSGSIY